MFHLDLRDLPESVPVTLQIDNGELVAESVPLNLSRTRRYELQPRRADYKEAWNSVSDSQEMAKFAVAGTIDEDLLSEAGDATLAFLEQTVGVGSDDVFLEIGCGVGRVGAVLAPRCKKWIGTDASENMCAHTAARLSHLPNVETVPISGWDLSAIPSASVDVVAQSSHPMDRPPQVSKSSTPERDARVLRARGVRGHPAVAGGAVGDDLGEQARLIDVTAGTARARPAQLVR